MNKHEEAIDCMRVAMLYMKRNPNVVEKEFERYSNAFILSMKALEKQIPMKATKHGDSDGEYVICPSCGCDTAIFNGKEQYCTRCGQYLKWSD